MPGLDVDHITTTKTTNKQSNNKDNVASVNNNSNNKVTLFFDTTEQHHKAYVAALARNLVTEVYSPPRVVKFAARHKLQEGHSIDIQCNDENGEPWDLNSNQKRNQLIHLIVDTKPILVIGSPMCTMFSTLQNLNKNKRDEEAHNARVKQAISHIDFCITLYTIQAKNGRYYLHEHPRHATSWKLESMQRFINKHQPKQVHANMCAFGMVSTDEQGKGLVCKPTTFMTNSSKLASLLSKHCNKQHRHVILMNGRAKQAAIYPDALCDIICKRHPRTNRS